MIEIINKEQCCGCGACEQICPKGSISLKADSEGFLYPNVEADKCIQCGLCDKVCPIQNTEKRPIDALPDAYLTYEKNSMLREKSASGGAFIALARAFVEKYEGVVFGAAYDEQLVVRHQFADSIEELTKFQKSKYVQSESSQSFSDVCLLLRSNRKVLYSGTPCQIYGLKSFLKTKKVPFDNLYCIDLSCHGVPSPKVQKEYLAWLEKVGGDRVSRICNREKKVLAHSYQNGYSVEYKNRKTVFRTFREDPMARCFFAGLISRPSCYQCSFKSAWRESDITLGDFWYGREYQEIGEDRRGVSLVLIQSAKGKELFDVAFELEKTAIDAAEGIKCNGGMIYKSDSPNAKRDSFFQHLGTKPLGSLADIYCPVGRKRKALDEFRKILVWKFKANPRWELKGKHAEWLRRKSIQLPAEIHDGIFLR